jgi:hypothetical protein
MSNIVYNIAKENLSEALLDLSTADLWLMLTFGYVPNADADSYVSAAVPYEVTGDGYTRVKLANVSLTRDTVNNRMVLRADDITWNQANFQADSAVIFVDTGNDAASMLITFLDFDGSKRSQYTPFIIQWSAAEGILNIR